MQRLLQRAGRLVQCFVTQRCDQLYFLNSFQLHQMRYCANTANYNGYQQPIRRGLIRDSCITSCGVNETPSTSTVKQNRMLYDDGMVKGASVALVDATSMRLRRRAHLRWDDGLPQTILMVKKPGINETSDMLITIGNWLQSKGLRVLVEDKVGSEISQFESLGGQLSDVDLCVTLGGDGTVLYLAGLLKDDTPLPPVVCFAMGTLGFLTPFDIKQFRSILNRILVAGRDPQNGEAGEVHHVLNECSIDRGSELQVVNLDTYVDGEYVTTVQSDGLIVSTPSGSTAYCMSAGGPMVAPSVPCTLLTPIAPLSLSFRPLVIPESSEVSVQLQCSSKYVARVSFDGRRNCPLQQGGYVRLTTSNYPLPLVNLYKLDKDWYKGITQKLGWNKVVKEGGPAPYKTTLQDEDYFDSSCDIQIPDDIVSDA